jgi:class 3 adenylate cyclase
VAGAELELSQAASATVRDLARRSELLFCWARLVGYGGIAVRYLVRMIDPTAVHSFPIQGRFDVFGPLIASYCVVSLLLLVRLRRAPPPPPWFGLASAIGDVLAFELALLALIYSFGGQVLELPGVLAAIAIVANMFAMGGSLRFRRDTAIISAVGAGVVFFTAAVYTRMPLYVLWGLTLMIVIAGSIGIWLARLVTAAARAAAARAVLSRFLPARVIDDAHADPSALLKPRKADATVVMSDVRGFTSWAESREPEEVLAFVSELQGELAAAVVAHGGTVDKFLGDGMLAVFGAPEPLTDHAPRAIAAVRDMLAAVRRLNQRGLEIKLGVGVNSGPLVAGCIGTGARLELTIIGDTVNTASRLQSLTKEHGVDVIIGEQTARALRDDERTSLGEATIRGKERTLQIYALRCATASDPAR